MDGGFGKRGGLSGRQAAGKLERGEEQSNRDEQPLGNEVKLGRITPLPASNYEKSKESHKTLLSSINASIPKYSKKEDLKIAK